MLSNKLNPIGEFQEKTFGKYFTYSKTNDSWAIANGCTHEIDVLDGVRFAKVLKTVAHVCVDENLFEVWAIKNHIKYKS